MKRSTLHGASRPQKLLKSHILRGNKHREKTMLRIIFKNASQSRSKPQSCPFFSIIARSYSQLHSQSQRFISFCFCFLFFYFACFCFLWYLILTSSCSKSPGLHLALRLISMASFYSVTLRSGAPRRHSKDYMMIAVRILLLLHQILAVLNFYFFMDLPLDCVEMYLSDLFGC